jgi:hypothetical protein
MAVPGPVNKTYDQCSTFLTGTLSLSAAEANVVLDAVYVKPGGARWNTTQELKTFLLHYISASNVQSFLDWMGWDLNT